MKRPLLILALLASMVFAAHAQDWARTKLDKSSRHQEWITVTNGTRAVQCFVVYPEIKNKATAIVMIHEIFGLTDWAREMADELAAQGYIVVAGFCWGGGQSFRFATNDKNLKAAFVFYGPPPNGNDLAKINCPVYGFYAGNDARITATVPKTAEEMKAAGKTYASQIYDGAGHGFMRAGEAPDANAANKKARESGFQRLLEVLEKI